METALEQSQESYTALWDSLCDHPRRWFAVVDGAKIDDLPSLLSAQRRFGRSLFLGQADGDVEKAGPWFVALDQAADARSFYDLIKSSAVFWSCEAGGTILYRHLRTINMARVPGWVADGHLERPAMDPVPEAEATVFFRHWDPDVLGALLPCLDADQFARILGPARQIAFVTENFGGFRRVLAKEIAHRACGILTIRSDQCDALIARRSACSQDRIASYLREYAPERTRDFPEGELENAIVRYDAQARHFGIRDEESIGLWSFMQVTSPVDLSRDPFVKDFMSDSTGKSHANQRVKELFDLRTKLFEDMVRS